MPSDHISSLCCSVQVFLTLLGSCAVVRPSQASDAEKDKQSNKWGSECFSQRGSVVVERRTCHGINWVNAVRMGLLLIPNGDGSAKLPNQRTIAET